MTLKIRYAGVVVCDNCKKKQVIAVEYRNADEKAPVFEAPVFWAKVLSGSGGDICPECIESGKIREAIRYQFLT